MTVTSYSPIEDVRAGDSFRFVDDPTTSYVLLEDSTFDDADVVVQVEGKQAQKRTEIRIPKGRIVLRTETPRPTGS
jgi:hypothetical protein